MNNPYKDIINLPHPQSIKHPQMSIHDRAAQFSPFAALTSHGTAIKETSRLTDRRIEISEDRKIMLDIKLAILADKIADRPEAAITYFLPDEKKAGGSYVTVSGTVKKIDSYERMMVLVEGKKIFIDDILEIESELFAGLE